MAKGIEDLSLMQLSLLVSLYETKNLTVTAAKQKITVSSAFRALKGLRDVLADPLFTRSGDGLQPTAFCTRLHETLPTALGELKMMLETEAEDYKSSTRTIRIICPDQIYSTVIDEAILAITAEAPNLTFQIFPRTNNLIARMRNGLVDFAFYPLFELANDFHYYELYDAGFVYLTAKNHPLARLYREKGTVSALDISRYRKIQFANSDIDDGHRIAVSNMSVPQQPLIQTSFMTASMVLLAESDLTMTVPTRLALKMAPYFDLQIIPLHCGWPQFKRRLIWHAQTHANPLFQWIRSMIITYSNPSQSELEMIRRWENPEPTVQDSD